MNLTVNTNRYKIDKNYLEKVAKTAFSFFDEKNGEIEVNFVGCERIRELNKRYRDIDKVTDVLSFDLDQKPLIGQIFICYNKAKEQAAMLGKKLDDELALILIHGILHLYGFDHENRSDAVKMENKERLILKGLGIKR